MTTRRETLTGLIGVGAGFALNDTQARAGQKNSITTAPLPAIKSWQRGTEGQRKADNGDGTYLNPIMAGAYSDPTVLKDGTDYYMTFSSFEADPGLTIWHSTDLVNWQPIGSALPQPAGSVFATDIIKYQDQFYIYIPMVPTPSSAIRETGIYVIHSDRMDGGWSHPVDTGIRGFIDPGHAVGEDGERYLFLSGGHRVRLSRDGLSSAGAVEKVYDGWKYPDDWITEAYALEGPKITRRGEFFYLISAVGGTGGPPTGHMVIAARSRSIHGPWIECPRNPIVRTTDASQAWWSRGHASLVEGPSGDWWMVYHGYENGYRTLGRQTLLEPVEWTSDGWPISRGGDLGGALPKPKGGRSGPHGMPRSDTFATSSIGMRWTFHGPKANEASRASIRGNSLILAATGTGPDDSAPLTNIAGDRAYQVSVKVELEDDATGGLLLFLSPRLFLGIAIDGKQLITYAGGRRHYWREPAPASRNLYLRIENREHIVTFYYSLDGRKWIRHGLRMECSGYNANTLLPGEGESLRPALFSCGTGSTRFRDYQYKAL